MIADKVNFSDGFGPHGYVILKDTKTGQIIFKGHNMITRAGKEYIFYTFLANALGKRGPGAASVTDGKGASDIVTTAFEGVLSSYKLAKCAFGSDNSATSYEALTLSNPIRNYVFPIGGEGGISCNANINAKTGENYIHFHIQQIRGDSSTAYVSELGLYLSKDENGTSTTIDGTDLMFSRIAFDPVPFTDNNEFSLDYYIYF